MEAFVARQPIFDIKQKVLGYELLYRVDNTNQFMETNGDMATNEVIANSLLLMGLETLTGGKRAFINFTENLLKKGAPVMLPADIVAIEVLESVRQDSEVILACKRLRDLGYTLVLDDFVMGGGSEKLIDLVDIVKIDFLNTGKKDRGKVIKRFKDKNIKFLAEKVETRALFEEAVQLGYSYFQGYFFSKPVIISSQDVPVQKTNYLQIICELNMANMDYGRIEEIVKRDVSLSYKLLKFINSAAFGFRTRINSIRHALVLLGMVEIKRWISLLALRSMSEDKPDEILTSSVVRARMGELLAPRIGMADKGADFFLLGLFSMLDVLLGRPMSKILTDLPIAEEVKDALNGEPGIYSDVMNLIKSYERAQWSQFSELAAKFSLQETILPKLYIEALEWADQFNNI